VAAKAYQKPGELGALIELLRVERPRVIVEVGADAGGTLAAWQTLGPAALVAISLPGGPYSSGEPLDPHGATVIEADSQQPETVERLRQVLGRDRAIDFLFIDADHTAAGVTRDVELYRPLVRPGGLIGLHDICHHPDHPEVGVEHVWASLSGRERWEFIRTPTTWGGIGVVRV
jgi:cephalosporin hydroxylase